jgi:hypothetical protein
MTTSAMHVLTQIFYDPAPAFKQILIKTRTWLPLLLSIVGPVIMLFWYFQTVDFAWLSERMLAAAPDLTSEQREMMQKSFSATLITWGTMVSICIMVPLTLAITGVYYLLAAKFVGSEIGFAKWFGFAAWISLPRLIVLPLMAVQILSSKGQVAMEDLSMTTLNFLVLHLDPSHPWAGLANSVDLTSLWTIVLSVVGLRVWTGRSLASCIVISLLPWLLIYGLWAGKILAFS